MVVQILIPKGGQGGQSQRRRPGVARRPVTGVRQRIKGPLRLFCRLPRCWDGRNRLETRQGRELVLYVLGDNFSSIFIGLVWSVRVRALAVVIDPSLSVGVRTWAVVNLAQSAGIRTLAVVVNLALSIGVRALTVVVGPALSVEVRALAVVVDPALSIGVRTLPVVVNLALSAGVRALVVVVDSALSAGVKALAVVVDPALSAGVSFLSVVIQLALMARV